ncbi:MAG TPA: prolyl aminopeptidase [Novimethylophilus sp.]|jgi:proline iminopeptidase|uniref:prolyl aminopeptidase n=1 Tax=Novimethylophilus sp. TaxID=2137426 RepID=UPI002F41A06E
MASPSESLIFPAIEPYSSGWIQTSSVHKFYYEECGNPAGAPVIVLHGGPGSGCTPAQRRFFDPAHYRVVLFDQRGCGRSEPAGCTENNTTQDLIADIECLRQHLDIGKWLVFGGSWGSTLALAYAATYPQHICGMVLRGIFLARSNELDWFLHQARHIFPETWEQFVSALAPEEQTDILTAYAHRISNDDASLHIPAARIWSAYETSIMTLLPTEPSSTPLTDAAILARARIQLHYLTNGCFISDTPLLDQVQSFRHIPAAIIQGRYDMVCPILSAHELHKAWPETDFHIVPDAGHAAFEPGIAAALIQATERFKSGQNP